VVRKLRGKEKLSKYLDKTHFNCAVIHVASRLGSEMLTVVSTTSIMANASIVDFSREI
jgi:hypothetical protein